MSAGHPDPDRETSTIRWTSPCLVTKLPHLWMEIYDDETGVSTQRVVPSEEQEDSRSIIRPIMWSGGSRFTSKLLPELSPPVKRKSGGCKRFLT